MKLLVGKNYEEVSEIAYGYLKETLESTEQPVLGLATGSSPIGLYKNMIEDYEKNGISYKNVKTFNLDEYFGLPQTHDQSYYYFMNENLFSHIDIDLENTDIPSGHEDNPQKECDEYNHKLNSTEVDIQVLGIGTNGHIGFNEPGTPFEQETHVIELDEQTRIDNARFFDSIEEVPTHAITMGIKNILKAKKILLIATGEKKAEAIYKMFEEEPTTDLPASALQYHPNVYVVCDEEAASLLTNREGK
jgi:glucosamine-6-phosphate deaminase